MNIHENEGSASGRGLRSRGPSRLIVAVVAITTVTALSACGVVNAKTFDIAPIFPLSPDKCAKYGGNAQGSGFNSHCWVTQTECKQAATDWRMSMQQHGVTDAIEFSCN